MTLDLRLEDSPYLLDQHGPIFILGCPRSGTTFLSHCIGSIDLIETFEGTIAPPRLLHLIAEQGTGELENDEPGQEQLLLAVRDIFWQSFLRRRRYGGNFTLYERFVQAVKSRNPTLLLHQSSFAESLFCYRDPFLCFAIEQLARQFVNAKFIHIIRDGRDTADSMERSYPLALSDAVLKSEFLAKNKNVEIGRHKIHHEHCLPWWIQEGQEDKFINSSRYGRTVWLWQEMVSRVLKFSENLGDERYLELRYESVVANPQRNAQKILGFLGFEAGARLLNELSKAYTSSVGISQTRQSSEKLDEANRIAGDLLRTLTYE